MNFILSLIIAILTVCLISAIPIIFYCIYRMYTNFLDDIFDK
jgi:hypothetical protein